MNITQRNNHKFFQQPKNEYIQLYSSRNKENISDNNTDKKHIHMPSKSSSLIKSNFFFNNNQIYKIHYYTIKINSDNSEEINKNKTKYYPFVNNHDRFLMNIQKLKMRKNKKLNFKKINEKKNKTSNNRELFNFKTNRLFEITNNIKNKFYFFHNSDINNKILNKEQNQISYNKSFFSKKMFNNPQNSFSLLRKNNSFIESWDSHSKLHNGFLFQNVELKKVINKPSMRNSSMDFLSFLSNRK